MWVLWVRHRGGHAVGLLHTGTAGHLHLCRWARMEWPMGQWGMGVIVIHDYNYSDLTCDYSDLASDYSDFPSDYSDYID